MTKQSYFSIVLIAIVLLLTALAIMVVFTTSAFAGPGTLTRITTISSVITGANHPGITSKGDHHEIRSRN